MSILVLVLAIAIIAAVLVATGFFLVTILRGGDDE